MSRLLVVIGMLVLLSCEEVVNVENISDDTIVLVAPSDAATLARNESIRFDWERLNAAEEYRLQIASPDFEAPLQIALDTLITGVSFRIDSLKENNYQWRVQGLNSAYQTSYSVNDLVVGNP